MMPLMYLTWLPKRTRTQSLNLNSCTAEQTDTAVVAASTTILRATSNAIGGGMKLVGQTVSRLSSSFSMDKDDGNSGGAADDAHEEAMSLTVTAAKAEFPLLDLEPRRTPPKEFAAVESRWKLHSSS